MNTAQHNIINLLKTSFSLVFVYLMCGPRQFFFQYGQQVGHTQLDKGFETTYHLVLCPPWVLNKMLVAPTRVLILSLLPKYWCYPGFHSWPMSCLLCMFSLAIVSNFVFLIIPSSLLTLKAKAPGLSLQLRTPHKQVYTKQFHLDTPPAFQTQHI